MVPTDRSDEDSDGYRRTVCDVTQGKGTTIVWTSLTRTDMTGEVTSSRGTMGWIDGVIHR